MNHATQNSQLSPRFGPSGPGVLRAEGVHRYLGADAGRVHVLRGVSLEARRGEVYAIVGPSGCGKSTLLYLLGLLDRPDGGEIWVEGRPLAGGTDEERTAVRSATLGFVFQFHFLLAEFTAQENVMIPMRRLGRLSEREMDERSAELLREVGLGDKLHRLGGQLSGGEQQRVAIARALANSPAVLLADEPTGNLDARNSELVFDLLTRLAKEKGQAVITVTHNPEIARRCDRVLSMLDGRFVS